MEFRTKPIEELHGADYNPRIISDESLDIDGKMQEAQMKEYNTCRNWQFANTIKRILKNEIDIANREVQ